MQSPSPAAAAPSVEPAAEEEGSRDVERSTARARPRIAAVTAVEWPLPRGFREHLALDTKAATVAYWGGVALVALSLFVSKLLPCVDYPQHLALADVARRLESATSPDHAAFRVNWFTYNGLFHFLVAKLSHVLPIETAGRVVVAGSLVLLAGATLALVRVLRRPPSYAALFTPILFSFSVGWGFVNYALASAIAVTTLVFVARALVRPTAWNVGAVGALGLLCAFGHVLAMLVLCLSAAAIAPEIAWRASVNARGGPARRALIAALRMALALAPLLIGCWFCIKVYGEQYEWDPAMYKDPTLEGISPPIWQKIVFFGAFATDLHYDHADQVFLLAAIVVMVAAGVVAWRRRGLRGEDSAAFYVPLTLLAVAYLATPMVLIGTHLIFPRLAQGVILGAVLATPRIAGALGRRIERYALAIGIAAGLSLVVHTVVFAVETDDASRVIDDLPAGRRATSVVYSPGTFSYRNGALVHLHAYYAARKHARWAYSFARYLSVPVRFLPGSQPPWPAKGWEFTAWDYDARCGYARHFDLVIVKQPEDIAEMKSPALIEKTVRARVFGKDADAVKLLSHHGEYWGFDTAGLPDDGTP